MPKKTFIKYQLEIKQINKKKEKLRMKKDKKWVLNY